MLAIATREEELVAPREPGNCSEIRGRRPPEHVLHDEDEPEEENRKGHSGEEPAATTAPAFDPPRAGPPILDGRPLAAWRTVLSVLEDHTPSLGAGGGPSATGPPARPQHNQLSIRVLGVDRSQSGRACRH